MSAPGEHVTNMALMLSFGKNACCARIGPEYAVNRHKVNVINKVRLIVITLLLLTAKIMQAGVISKLFAVCDWPADGLNVKCWR